MSEKEITRPTVMEVNIDNFKHNIEQIRNKLKPDVTVMPIMKANAYGTYLNTRLDVVNEFEIIGLATVDEGVELRNLGYQKDIFILNQPSTSEIDKIIENNLIVGLSSKTFLEEVKKQNKEMRVHIEIETGMGRTGISFEEIPSFIEEIQKYKNIKIEGIYTHLSSPDMDNQYTKEQLETFQKAVENITLYVKDVKYIHAAASNLKTVKEGTSISYDRDFITKRESKIATIPIGYADGLRRGLSNNGQVVIRGQKVPIIGKICMDRFMADVTDLQEVEIGDEVWIWDNNQVTLDEIAYRMNTINYEIISTISSRVPRKFETNRNRF